MKFTHRLGYYFGGLAIGLIFLAFFLRKKSDATGTSFCYLPNCRVLKELRAHPLKYTNDLLEDLATFDKDTTMVAYFLREGKIDFKASDTRGTPCKIYFIDQEYFDKDYTLKVFLCDSLVTAERLTYKH